MHETLHHPAGVSPAGGVRCCGTPGAAASTDIPLVRGSGAPRCVGSRPGPAAGTGLTPADFKIFEDGKPQQISVFQAVDLPDPEAPSAPWIHDVAPDVRSNTGLQERRLFLLIIDDATLQPDL
ncbi:MAG: hypothetical protein H0W08_13585, partial [Acidobacteria bacterium]|nr:hypothetical protein [Acidobacteriota bacterium]